MTQNYIHDCNKEKMMYLGINCEALVLIIFLNEGRITGYFGLKNCIINCELKIKTWIKLL